MTDFVDQFRRLALLLLKWALIGIVVVAGLTGAAVAAYTGWEWWTEGRHKANVVVRAFIDTAKCDDAKFPLAIEVVNKSARAIEKTMIWTTARRPGRSTDLSSGSFDSDQIIKPGEGWGSCWSVRLTPEGKDDDPRRLEWSVRNFWVTFAD